MENCDLDHRTYSSFIRDATVKHERVRLIHGSYLQIVAVQFHWLFSKRQPYFLFLPRREMTSNVCRTERATFAGRRNDRERSDSAANRYVGLLHWPSNGSLPLHTSWRFSMLGRRRSVVQDETPRAVRETRKGFERHSQFEFISIDIFRKLCSISRPSSGYSYLSSFATSFSVTMASDNLRTKK